MKTVVCDVTNNIVVDVSQLLGHRPRGLQKIIYF